jgi:hypothetical protein
MNPDPLADLDALRAALRRPDFGHVRYRPWCGAGDTPEARQVLADNRLRPQPPGQMGQKS